MINFDCNTCGKTIVTEPENAGLACDCPGCGSPIVIPTVAVPPPVLEIAQPPQLPPHVPHQSNPTSQNPTPGTKWSKNKLIGAAFLFLVFLCVIPKCGGDSPSTGSPASPNVAQNETPNLMPCSRCSGKGQWVDSCQQCKGRRTFVAASGFEMVCPNCQGKGGVATTCPGCSGAGRVPYSRENIYAPPHRDYNANDPMGEYN
jgi:DNA-directed RNA polymerase subunit RPC12/RpoP